MGLYSSGWNQYYTSQAHTSIASGYNNAITYFAQQKRNFLKNLECQTDLTLKNFMNELNQAIEVELDSELGQTFDEAFNAVSGYIEQFFVNNLQNGNTSYQELLSAFDKIVAKENTGQVDPSRQYNNMKKHIENYLAINNIDRSGLAQYVASQTSLGKTNNTDIQNNLFGYARRLVLQQLRGGELQYNTQKYKTSLKGYYKEELLTSALQKVLEKYGLKSKQMGSERNEKGQQIQVDIGIFKMQINDPLTPFVNSLQAFGSESSTSNTTLVHEDMIGGIQSKSWIAPWENAKYNANMKWLSVGSHAELMPQGHSAYYWHAGVNNVMKNLVNVIGAENFIFSTGGGIYFTSDMLTKFREAQYVFAFYKRKEGKIESPGVGGQPHEDG